VIPPGLVFVSSSHHKHREVEAILNTSVERIALDLPEIQGLDLVAVALAKARLAFERLGRPVLVEDTGLELTALGGFPGPLVRWLLQAAGAAALPAMLTGFADHSATARCAAVVADGERELVGVGAVAGRILESPRGQTGFGWDVVFAPDWGDGRVYAEMTLEEKNTRSHRALALHDLARTLRAQ
jgi:non-canonical purine NTP pyrophosphatase (RdgB/HAM1 family)